MNPKRRRRGARGIAVVEAVIVVPTLLLLFASLVFTEHLYAEKARVTNASRLEAWAYAGTGCGDVGDPGPGDPRSSPTPGSLSMQSIDNGNNGNSSSRPVDLSAASSAAHGVSASAHADTLSKNLGIAAVRSAGAAHAGPFLGGFRASVSSRRTVMCNEPPYSASLPDVVKSAFHTFTSW